MSTTTERAAPAMEAAEVVWHDLECADYSVDLPAWRALARGAAWPPASAPILDIGAGTGRVTLDLAYRGQEITAVDVSERLLAALAKRAAGLRVSTVCADARELDLPRRDYALCIVPMQTLQLFGGAHGRAAFLTRVREHLRPGGRLACALLSVVEPFDVTGGDEPPPTESAVIDGLLYESRTSSVRVLPRSVVIERERRILATGAGGRVLASGRALFELDRLGVAALGREARGAGFAIAPSIKVPPTVDHVGSTIAVLDV